MQPLSDEAKEALLQHVAASYGPIDGEITMPTPVGPVTLLHVPPTPDVPFHALVTAGMSAAPMNVPDDVEDAARYAELVMLLPFEWPVETGLSDGRVSWPLQLLARTAAFPAEADAWLGLGHSIPNGEPPEPFVDGLDFCGIIIAPPMSLPPHGRTFRRPDGAEVELMAVLPVFERELELKRKEGMPVLLKRFDAAGVNELFDGNRSAVAGLLVELLDRK